MNYYAFLILLLYFEIQTMQQPSTSQNILLHETSSSEFENPVQTYSLNYFDQHNTIPGRIHYYGWGPNYLICAIHTIADSKTTCFVKEMKTNTTILSLNNCNKARLFYTTLQNRFKQQQQNSFTARMFANDSQ